MLEFKIRQTSIADRIEQINDLAKGNMVDVIVQMESPTKVSGAARSLASAMVEQRKLSMKPSDIVDSRKIASRRRRKARTTRRRSRSSQVAASKKTAFADLTKILKIDSIGKSMARLETTSSRKQEKKGATFWTSKSMLLRLTKQELEDLPDEIPAIRDIRLNRKLSVPIIKTNELLAIETEDRLSTTWGIDRANAHGAWGVYGAEGQGVTVGVLDTGIDPDHPDIDGKIAHWAEFDAMGNIVNTTDPRDSDQHGTHVAGTIVGGDASGRWIGMAPQAKVAAGLVLDGSIGGTDAQVLAGMDWAVETGVDVINMSLGGLVMDAETPPTYSEAIVSAMFAGIPVVCAIGNEGEQTTGLPGSDLFALSVGATDVRDRTAGFSGGRTQIIFESEFLSPNLLPFSYIKPDLSAPGVAVFSSVPGGDWESFSGTSMATPHVAGAIAMLLSVTNIRETLDGQERVFTISDLLNGAVEDFGESGQDSRYGFGRLDILRAIDFAYREKFGV